MDGDKWFLRILFIVIFGCFIVIVVQARQSERIFKLGDMGVKESLISIDGGKYVVENNNGIIKVLRNGEPWRSKDASLIGDGFVLALVQEIEKLKASGNKQIDEIDEDEKKELIRALQYAWEERGDITRTTYYYEKYELIMKLFPDVIFAWEKLKIAERQMNRVVKEMGDSI